MYEKYIKIDFSAGSALDQAIDELLSYRRKGILAYGEFNGITLYSDTVKKDEAYKKVTGQTIFEFKKIKQEMIDDY